jgi:hypothetical protein
LEKVHRSLLGARPVTIQRDPNLHKPSQEEKWLHVWVEEDETFAKIPLAYPEEMDQEIMVQFAEGVGSNP